MSEAKIYLVNLRSGGKKIRTAITGWSKEDAEARLHDRFPQYKNHSIEDWLCNGRPVPAHWRSVPQQLIDHP